MPFADQGVALEPFCFQDLPSQDSMREVGRCSAAVQLWGLAEADADIMQHRRLGQEIKVGRLARMAACPMPGNLTGLGSHQGGVDHQQPENGSGRIVMAC